MGRGKRYSDEHLNIKKVIAVTLIFALIITRNSCSSKL